MEFTIEREVLCRLLKTVEVAVPNTTSLPVLTNIYFESTGSELRVRATNLEIDVLAQVPFDSEFNNVKALIPSRVVGIVNSLSEKQVKLRINQGQLTITCGSAKFKLSCSDPSNYPELSNRESEKDTLKLTEAELKSLIKQVVFATSTNNDRPAFTGVLFSFEQDAMKLIASDTYRLVLKKMNKRWGYEKSFLLIPAKSLKELIRIIGDSNEEIVEVFPHGNQVVFKTSKLTFVANTLVEKFPDVTGVIPSANKSKVIASRKSLEEIVGRANLLAEGNNQAIKFVIRNAQLEVSVNSEIGAMQESVEVEKTGEDVEVYLNSRFVLEVLKIFDNEKFELEFNGSVSPVIMRPQGDSEYLYLVLPIKMQQ